MTEKIMYPSGLSREYRLIREFCTADDCEGIMVFGIEIEGFDGYYCVKDVSSNMETVVKIMRKMEEFGAVDIKEIVEDELEALEPTHIIRAVRRSLGN